LEDAMTARDDDLDPGSTFAERLTYAIRLSGLSEKEILDAIETQGGHLSRTSLHRLKTGVQQNPQLATISWLAKVLGCSVAFLTDFDSTPAAAAAVEDAETQAALEILRRDAGVKTVLFRMGEMSSDARQVLANMSAQLVQLNAKHAQPK
jgi:transcriptional regulator with XRE-family HTH domain